MRLTCPHCQQSVTVPDTAAGQSTSCPNCHKLFTPPALIGAAIDAAPEPPPVVTPPAPPTRAAGTTVAGPGTSLPNGPGATPAGDRDRSLSTAGAHPCCRLTLRREVVHWLAPAALGIAFLLTFFSWVGVYPNGTPVFTQNAWKGASGSFAVDAVGGDVMKREEDVLHKYSGWSLFLLLYLILLILTVPLALADRILPAAGVAVPDVFRGIWPHRQMIVAGLCAALLVLLFFALAVGFGLETAAARAAEEAVPLAQGTDGAAPTPRQLRLREVQRDVALSHYALAHTTWLTLAVIAQIVALAGAGLAVWLDRHPDRPEPRVEVFC